MLFLRKISLPWFLLAALSLFAGSCRDTPRDNPFDPQSAVLLVSVNSPADSSVFFRGDTISFRVSALRGFDNQLSGKEFLWSSDIAGFLSSRSDFSTDSLPAGTHRITVSAIDEAGRRGTAVIKVTVLPTPEFGVRIKIPPADTIMLVGSSLQPEAREYVPAGSRIIGRLWRFGEGSGIPNSALAYPGTVVWDRAGSFLLVYQIVDELGRTAADSILVTVLAESVPPIVAIVSPSVDTTLTVGDSVFFEALEIKTTARIMHRDWVYPSGSGLESQIDKVLVPGWRHFASPGTFLVVFRATDALGVSSADTVTVTVSDLPPAPKAVILSVSDDTTITRGDSIRFEGGHTPSETVVISRRWIYDQASGIPASQDTVDIPGWRKFNLIGEFRIFFTVNDRWGRSSSDTLTVRVVENRPPLVEITRPSTDTTIYAGDSLVLAGTAFDPDGIVDSTVWYFGIVGGSRQKITSPRLPLYLTLSSPGEYRVYYSATDNRQARGEDTVSVQVVIRPVNQPPLASILNPSADTTIAAWTPPLVFMATDSDPDGTVVTRSWSFGLGSGVSSAGEDRFVTSPKTFTLSGSFMVVYTVTDNRGATGRDSVRVTVLPNSRPSAQIISLLGDATIAVGDSLLFIGIDSDQDGQIVSRAWNYGAGSGIDAAADTVNVPGYRTFHLPGTFNVTFKVIDNKGAANGDSLNVTVNP